MSRALSSAESEALARFPYNTTVGHDHLAWAKRILYREEQRDPTLTTLQVTFANMAMGRVAA